MTNNDFPQDSQPGTEEQSPERVEVATDNAELVEEVAASGEGAEESGQGEGCSGCSGCQSDCSGSGSGEASEFDAEGEAGESEESGTGEGDSSLLCIRYGRMGQLGLFRSKLGRLPYHSRVVIKSDRGLEIGTVLCAGNKQLSYEERPLRVMGAVRRVATHDDLMEDRHLQQSASRERKYCVDRIRERKLPMKLVDVEHLFGGDRIIFYFLSDGRVDFRELVRDLAQEYQTRIEMRQIGVRDEARLMADYERCGQYICCRAFIKEFKPVTMRMAKVQKATLDPSKISGRCGRLMCCLRYENETYNDLKERLPRRNSYVRTAEGVGKVIGGDIMTQLVKVAMVDKVHIVPVDELLQRNVAESEYLAEQQAALEARQRRFTPRGPRADRSSPRRDRSSENLANMGAEGAAGGGSGADAGAPAAKSAELDIELPTAAETTAAVESAGSGDAGRAAAAQGGGASGEEKPDSASRRRRQRRKRRKQAAAQQDQGSGEQGAKQSGDEGGSGEAEAGRSRQGGGEGSGGGESSRQVRQSRRGRDRRQQKSGGEGGQGGQSRRGDDLSIPRSVLEQYGADTDFLDKDKSGGGSSESGDKPAGGEASSGPRQKRRRRKRRKPRTGGGSGSSGPGGGSSGGGSDS